MIRQLPGAGQGQLRHRHRVIPGDEDLRRNLQGHPGKVPLAQDIGQRLIALHPGQHTRQRFGDIRRGVNIPAGDDLRRRLPRRSSQQLPGAIGGVFALGRAQGLPGGEEKIAIAVLYHRSSPSRSGNTSSSARMATSIMESSGSFVVKFCSAIPG